MNQNMRRHMVTLENPIEFLHRDINCSITQREIGVDTENFRHGLRAALRQDPDVILIGEMRDTESIDIALKSAETGHLVISTVHTRDAASTISRAWWRLPARGAAGGAPAPGRAAAGGDQPAPAAAQGRQGPRAGGRGDGGDRHHPRLHRATPTAWRRSASTSPTGAVTYGMQTFDQRLMELVQSGQVEYEVAKAAATNPGDFELKMNMLSSRGGSISGSYF